MRGLHVTNSIFGSFLHGMHALLDPLCSSTADVDATYDWAPCTTAKATVVVVLHLALFACMRYARARAPPVFRKTVVQQANEVFLSNSVGPAASSSAIRGPGGAAASGLVQRR